jgi:hypothetical protein
MLLILPFVLRKHLLSSLDSRSFSKQNIWKRSVPVGFIRWFLRANLKGSACNPDACDFANLQLPAPLSWPCGSFPTPNHPPSSPTISNIDSIACIQTRLQSKTSASTAKSLLPEFTPTFADPTGHFSTTSRTSVEINKVRNKNSHIIDYSIRSSELTTQERR